MSELVLEDAIILRKIELILNHWDPLCTRYVNAPAHPIAAEPSPQRQSSSSWNFGAKSETYTSVVRAILDNNLLAARTILYDLDAVDMAFQTIAASFPAHFEHRFQVSACPLAFFLRRAIENDVGLTCSSIVEVQHALHLGCAPHKIVFNSPWKSRLEIAYAINAGVEVNADSFEEIELIREHAQQRFQSNFPECTPRYAGELPRIGVRIHACLHKVDPKWTIGIPLTKSNRASLIQAFVDNPWLSGLQAVWCPDCDVDSMKQLTHGAQVICDLANEIDAIVGEDRVKVLNIGGHLSANYNAEEISPTFADCVEMLRNDASKIFERNGRVVLTEFGQYISSKVGWTLSQIEHLRNNDSKSAPTAVVQAGPDLFKKDSEASFQHRLTVYKSDGVLSTSTSKAQQLVCFGSNHSVFIRDFEGPTVEEGDLIVLHDTGSNMNTRSLGFEQSPPVYGYRIQDDVVKLILVKPEASPEQVIQAWS